jgi:hypothetical protein
MLFGYPLAGIVYQILHYLIGLRRLGYDPYYIEDSSRWVFDVQTREITDDVAGNVATVAPVLARHGFPGQWACRNIRSGAWHGLGDVAVRELYRSADALLNISGAQEITDEHRALPRRIYVETDPFSYQVDVATGFRRTVALLAAHDTHFTFGENIGASDCSVPVARFDWRPTRQPVVQELWSGPRSGRGASYTTITTWRSDNKDRVWDGETYYWTKGREFLRFAELPRRHRASFELAVDEHEDARKALDGRGWRVTSARALTADPDRYRSYIQRSRGEFTVARDQYVRPCTGWFSDRSACYLAAGVPVVTQDTGFGKVLPTGKGLYAFTTLDDALAAIDAIEADPEGNRRAASEIAAEYFAAERVVGNMMARAGL